MKHVVKPATVARLVNYYISSGITRGLLFEELIIEKTRTGLKSTIRRHLRKGISEKQIIKAIDLAYEDTWMKSRNIYLRSYVFAIESCLNRVLSENREDTKSPVVVDGKELDFNLWGYYQCNVYIPPANSSVYSGLRLEILCRQMHKGNNGKWNKEYNKYFEGRMLKNEWSFVQ